MHHHLLFWIDLSFEGREVVDTKKEQLSCHKEGMQYWGVTNNNEWILWFKYKQLRYKKPFFK
jgi:hypothetical protein